jgi:hypothetical protein
MSTASADKPSPARHRGAGRPFCITKTGAETFSVVPQQKAQKVMRGSEIRNAPLLKGKIR